ncbi:Cupredoxin [Chlamydoabsidia padenii]|nr:Cupredoxin [Chlamydoabsidia padenii]
MYYHGPLLRILLLSVMLCCIPTFDCRPITLGESDIKFYEFNITTTTLNPDCSNYSDPNTIVINGQMPAPTITVTKGQRVQVLVRNALPLSSTADPMVARFGGGNTNMVTVHYHGIRQHGSNQADGVPFLTQDPIPPGGNFLYDFICDAPGTYFYHAHVGLQERSLFGAIVVYESNKADPAFVYDQGIGPSAQLTDSMAKKQQSHDHQPALLALDGVNGSPNLTYHDDRLVVLSEWFHEDRFAMESYLLGPNFTILHEANSVLVNGQTINNESTVVSTHKTPCRGYNVINVEKGKTYRFRVIGASTFRTFGFSIAGHRLKIIEVDGGLVEPYDIDHLEVSAGQRYSVLVTMDQPVKDYAIGTIRLWADGVDPTSNGWAILRYQDSADNKPMGFRKRTKPAMTLPHGEPALPKKSVPYWIWDKLAPLGGVPDPIALRPRPDRTIILGNKNGPLVGSPGTERFYVNDVTFMEPSTTLLSQVLNGVRKESPLSIQQLSQEGHNGYDPYLGTYPLAHMEVVDIVIQNTRSVNLPCRSHPWHTHGHSHWLIAQGPGSYDEAAHGHIRNIPFPVLKDTTLVYPEGGPPFNGTKLPSTDQTFFGCGWAKIRILADNPGYWAMHCHNTPHMFMGMMIILEESPELIPGFIRRL